MSSPGRLPAGSELIPLESLKTVEQTDIVLLPTDIRKERTRSITNCSAY